jgi:hypothetical protein
VTRALAALLVLALQAFAGGVVAGPVPAAEASDGNTGAHAAPSMSIRLLDEGTAATAAASAASGSALAVEIIKEADAGTAAIEAPRQPNRETVRAVTPPTAARSSASATDDPWGLRDMGKTAVQWVKDAVPWLRSDEDTPDAGQSLTLGAADWSASPLEGGQAGRGARLASNPPPAAGPGVDPLSAVSYGDPARPKVVDSEGNLVSVVINVFREVLEHPMTWLVVSLFVIGGIVIKRFDRRPTE